ncbi:polysaccharide deacetylase family protein [Desulfosporosinus sp. PR]|nr:polysaccharide deacetylase family protein [Desulfosporosinus sp. PR]
MIVIGISCKIFFHESDAKANAAPQTPKPAVSSANMALQDKASESLDQLSPATAAAPEPLKAIYEFPVNQPVVYITMDDGWYPNQTVLKLMKQYHLPITTYLIEQAAENHPEFWHDFVKAGGHIEDHTFSHPFLTHLSPADQISQISQPIAYFQQFGSSPDELRPPYGDLNETVEQTAQEAGIKHIVMWNAEMKNSVLTTRSGQKLKAGDIVLLHWEPGVDQELVKLLTIIQKQNLGVADLTQALNGENLTVSWLKAPLPASKPPVASTAATTAPAPAQKAITSKTKSTANNVAAKTKP